MRATRRVMTTSGARNEGGRRGRFEFVLET